MQEELLPRPSALRRWLIGAIADRPFHGLLVIWALCCLAVYLCIAHFGRSLPWCDEWRLTPIASGEHSLSVGWLLEPANEHRAPLTRLNVFVIGRLAHWNWQAMHYVSLVFMALGALAMLCAARSIRGRSTLSDSFLCLVVLTPWQWETVWQYGYAYGAAGGLTCIALSLAAVRWPQRSLTHLASYVLTVLAVSLAGGPPGNLLALGLAAALAPGFRETASRAWKVSAGAGASLIVIVSGLLLAFIPSTPHHANYLSDSLLTTLKATARETVCWLGMPVLEVLWPWAFLIVLLPSLWVAGRAGRDLLAWRRGDRRPMREWLDLVPVWLAALAVAAAIAYGRARIPLTLWSSRYVMLTIPIGIVLYFFLVRLRAPLAFPQTLAVLMAVCCGWCWPAVLAEGKAARTRTAELVQTLTQGDVPLSDLCGRYCHDVGLSSVPDLIGWMMQMRQSDQSIFRAINRRKRRAGVPLPQAWKADSGQLGADWEVIPDKDATQLRTLHVSASGEQPALAVYHIQVPVAGAYRLCCRMRASKEHSLTVVVDGVRIHQQTFPAAADYQPCLLADPLRLEPGEHVLALALSRVSSDLDVVELVPQASGR
ncbi:MAG TPA: hypothetical protein VN688_16150 [Gemmataceae bacterium]|nr:hypothetical protein [Gemmataceae bacterium]